MDTELYSTTFDDIVALNATEGPHTNVLEPKYAAKAQMLTLLETIRNVYKTERTLLAMRQMCMCYCFLGSNMREVDENVEGLTEVQRAYRLLRLCANEELADSVDEVELYPMEEILRNEQHFLQKEHGYAAAVEFLSVHNTLGLYLSGAGKAEDAKKVLHIAERAYEDWDAWAQEQPITCTMNEVTLSDAGALCLDNVPGERREVCRLRYQMVCAYTSTLFFLAQVYTTTREVATASRYCHMTMFHQLQCRREFAAKVWAGNALQLSGFYSAHFEYGKAFHCLQAGERVMATEEPGEDTTGVVAWAYGRFYLHKLDHYGNIHRGYEPERAATGTEPEVDVSYWVDFPTMPPLQEQLPITTFDEARGAFKDGIKWLQDALQQYEFESSCTRHIEILQDMARLYSALALFETNRGRQIAMMQRQIAFTEDIPDKLSFNAYPTMVRQLLYDQGFLHEDLLRLRTEQRKEPLMDEKPLKDRAFNALVSKTMNFYHRFCETWRLPTTGEIPTILDDDSRLPFFRALMRMAQIQIHYAHATPKEEYEGIGEASAMYQRAVDFAEANPLPSSSATSIEKEVALARQMTSLLPVKQRDLWMAYQRTL